jgi:hypothetical protein
VAAAAAVAAVAATVSAVAVAVAAAQYPIYICHSYSRGCIAVAVIASSNNRLLYGYFAKSALVEEQPAPK